MDGLGTFLVVLNNDLQIENSNELFAKAVGFSGESGKVQLMKFISQRDRKEVETWIKRYKINDVHSEITFNFLASNRRYISVVASYLTCASADSENYVISALQESSADLDVETKGREIQFLRKVIDQSKEAMWCIEFQEPVNLLENEEEIVRQVFGNRCSLKLCNQAMMQLYDIPADADISELPVSRNFPRSRANEKYVRGLIHENFHVDSAISIDIKYGGQAIYGDNSVRSDIVDNRLIRLWGTMHDVTVYRQQQAQMDREHRSLQSILASIPEAVLVVGKDHRLKGANPAYETLVDQSIDFALDKKIESLFDFGGNLPELDHMDERSLIRCDVSSRHNAVESRKFVAWVAPLSGTDADRSLIITLRSTEESAKEAGTWEIAAGSIKNGQRHDTPQ